MKNRSHVWIGGLFIVAGLLFLLSNARLLSFEITKIVISWPMLIVATGLISLVWRNYFSAAVLLVVGSYFLIPKIYHVMGFDFPMEWSIYRNLFWAALFILAGLAIIFGSRRQHYWRGQVQDVRSNKDGVLQISCVFGETKHEVIEKPFTGAIISTAFGGSILDLRKTELMEGDTFIHVNTAFGGAELVVPESWHVVTHAKAVFGGIKDEKRDESNVQNSTHRLIINGSVVFGGVEVKRVSL